MGWNARTWSLISLLALVGAVIFWQLGNQHRSDDETEPKEDDAPVSTNEPPTAESDSGRFRLLTLGAANDPAAGGGRASPSDRAADGDRASEPPSFEDPDQPNRLRNTGAPVRDLVRTETALLLRNALIDTRRGTQLAIPDGLQGDGDPQSYIIQAPGPVTVELRRRIETAGGRIVSYIPNNAFLVEISSEELDPLRDRAQAIVPYEPYFKLQGELLAAALGQRPFSADRRLRVVLFPGQAARTQDRLQGLAREMTDQGEGPFGPSMVLSPQEETLIEMAQLSGVQRIEVYRPRATLNDLGRQRMGIAADPTEPAEENHLGLTGEGVVININDSGVDTSHPDLQGRVFAEDSSALEDPQGHGTHVAGTLAGSGENSPSGEAAVGSVEDANFRGMAPEAELFVLPVDLTTGPLISDEYLQRTAATNYFLTRGRTNTLLSNNSWGYIGVSEYDSSAASFDAAVRDALPGIPGKQPTLYVFAAGNEGFAEDSGLGGEPNGIVSPATGKNVITVGALEQFREITNEVVVEDASGPVSTNQPFLGRTDSDNEVLAISSRGNVGLGVEGEFGRFKPDVVAPGSFVVSARSDGWEPQESFRRPRVNNIRDQFVAPGERKRYDLFVPDSAAEVTIELLPNERSPDPLPGLPIFMRRGDFPTLQDLVNTDNEVTMPDDLPLETGTWFYSVGNFTDDEVSFDIRTVVVETNAAPGRLEALEALNEELGEDYRYETGTSMAAPMITGTLGLMQEYFEENDFSYSPALLKALLINGSRSVNRIYGFALDDRINHQGWGLPNITRILPARPFGDEGATVQFLDQDPEHAVATGDRQTWDLELSEEAREQQLRITLSWTDPPGNPNAGVKLVNDLDLIVTDEDSGEVYAGNAFTTESDFTIPVGEEGSVTNDVVNNVENVFLQAPLGENYSVSVVGNRVNVNAVTEHPDGIVQDFALAVSTVDPELEDAVRMSSAPEHDRVPPEVTTVTNAIPLLDQRVGPSSPLQGGEHGVSDQWRFYVFTNSTVETGRELSITNGTNVAFSTFVPPNLSEPSRNLDADLDLYVSRNPALTNLEPQVVESARKSRGRGGTETVTFTNAELDEVFYIGVKSEDHRGGEFGFVTLSSNRPFEETDDEGNRIVHGQPVQAPIPDGSPDRPEAGYVFAISPTEGIVNRVRAVTTLTHESIGDLSANLSHRGEFAVLHNHTVSEDFPPGTRTFVFDDSNRGDIADPSARTSDGPGDLNDFVGQPSSGLWLLTVVDNALNEGGTVDSFRLMIEPVPEDRSNIQGTVQANRFTFFSVDVPQDATNLVARLSSIEPSAPLDLYVRRGRMPTTEEFDKLARIEPPGGELSLTPRDTPPLNPGRYFVAVFNPNSFSVDFRLTLDVQEDPEARGLDLHTAEESRVLKDDAITRSTIEVPRDLRIADIRVGIRADHPRVSDLAARLISPQGARLVLAENRGRQEADQFGLGETNFSYLTFTENTNLTTTPMKFADPPFRIDEAQATVTNRLVATNGFEGVEPGIYTNGTSVSGWTVSHGDITIESSENAHTGTNFVRLSTVEGGGGVTTNVQTVVGREYLLSFAHRRGAAQSTTAVYTNNVLAKFVPPPSGSGWQSTSVVFRATSPETSFELRSATSQGSLIDSVGILEVMPMPDRLFLPEESLERVIGERALGDWTLELWDTRTGPDDSPPELLDWKLEIAFANPTIAANRLTNGIPFTGSVTENEIEYFVVDVPRSASFATNRLAGTGDLILLGDRGGLPVGDRDQDDYFVDRLGSDEGEFLLLGPNQPPAAPLRPGRRYYLGVQNVNPTESNEFTIQVDFDQTDEFDDSDIPLLEDGVARSATIPEGPELDYYKFDVSDNAVEALFELLPENGNANLFIRRARDVPNPLPTADLWDYRSIRSGSDPDRVNVTLDSLPVPLNPGRWYIGVQNVEDFDVDYEVRVTEQLVDVTDLVDGEPVGTTHGNPGGFEYFAFDVPDSAVTATFESFDADGNIDLILRKGLPLPSFDRFDYVSDNPGLQDESIVVTNTSSPVPLSPGRWYVGAFNNEDEATAYTVEATAESPPLLTLTDGVTETNRLEGTNQVDYYQFDVSEAAERVFFETFDADGDIDLFVRREFPLPTHLNFDYASANEDTGVEAITVRTNSLPVPLRGGQWLISVVNQQDDPVNYSIRAEEFAPTIHTLTNNVPVTREIEEAAAFDFYRFTVSSDAEEVLFETSEADGDVDLFLRKGLPPATDKNFDYASTNEMSGDEAIVVNVDSAPVPLEPGDWFASVLNQADGPVTYTIEATERGEVGPPGRFLTPDLRVEDDQICLTWASEVGQQYLVQGKETVDGPWQDISESIEATETTTEYCIDLPTDYRFFRIAVIEDGEPPPPSDEFITPELRVEDDQICLTWASEVGQQYLVQGKETVDGPWQDISESIEATETTTEYCIDLPTDYRYFRIAVIEDGEPPPPSDEFITPELRVEDDQICLTWASEVGQQYEVQARQSLETGAWEAISEPIEATETTTEYCIDLPTDYRYFRIAIVGEGGTPPGDGTATDPQEILEQTEFGSLQMTADGFELSWTAPPNQSFQVQYTTAFPPDWTTLPGTVSSQDGNYSFVDEDLSSDGENRFYRLVLQP